MMPSDFASGTARATKTDYQVGRKLALSESAQATVWGTKGWDSKHTHHHTSCLQSATQWSTYLRAMQKEIDAYPKDNDTSKDRTREDQRLVREPEDSPRYAEDQLVSSCVGPGYVPAVGQPRSSEN